MKKSKVKKVAALLLIGLTFMGYAGGCGNTSSDNNDSETSIEVKNDQEIVTASAEELEDAPFKVTVLNTKNGAADSILIKIKDECILIDCGLSDDGKKLKKLINNIGEDTIDYLILSHLDKDHIGGADKIIEKFNVKNIIQPDYVQDGKQYEQYLQAAEQKNIKPMVLTENMKLEINGAKINIYAPEKARYNQSNNYSIIVEIEYGNYNYLFAGDAEADRLAEFLSSNDKQYTFVKIPHHGRYNSMTSSFLQSVAPKYAVITCSKEEPAEEKVTSILDKMNTETLITTNGNVIIRSDGEKINMSQEVITSENSEN